VIDSRVATRTVPVTAATRYKTVTGMAYKTGTDGLAALEQSGNERC